MIFNGIEKSYITVLRDRSRPFFATDGERIITVPVYIEHNGFPDYQKIKEDMAYWLKHDEPKPLEFKDDSDRLYYAEVTDIVQGDEYSRSAVAEIVFVCGSKYSLERTISVNLTASRLIEGHKSTPWKSKTVFSTAETNYEIQFNSPGKTELREINKIKLNYEFVAGDVLEIDYSRRSVSLNGNDITNTVSILQSNFMELPIGDVEFEASHETEVYYNERFY